jgi:acetolactate synthase-1/2/3 large subunit
MSDQFAAMAAVVDDARRVTTPAEAVAAVRDAFAAFASSRPRPRYVEVPLDVVDVVGEVDEAAYLPATALPPVPDDAALAAAGAVLASALRPAVVAGGGAARAGEQLRAVAEALGAPVVTSTNGRGVLAEDHPLALAAALHLAPVQEWLRGCDAVLVVGSELAESDAWTTDPLVRGQVVRIDLDPAQDGLAAPAGAMLVGDAAATLAALLEHLPVPEPRPSAAADLVALRAARDGAARESAARWAPLLAGLREALPPDAVVATDNSMAAYRGALVGLPMVVPASYLFPTGFGTLGFAVPAAVGAALAAPERAVVAITGDGGLQFTLNELATLADVCRAQGRGVAVVVVTNDGYGEIRAQQVDRGDVPSGVDLTAPDWVRLAEAFGGRGVRLAAASGDPACAAEAAAAVAEALVHPVPTLVVVRETAPASAPPKETTP